MRMKKTISSKEQALLTLIVIGFCLAVEPLQAQSFGVFRELWSGLSTGDASLALLTNTANNPNWPNNPNTNYSKVFTSFQTETDMMDGYGQRLRAYLVPPLDGDYLFWISSDDGSSLYLSTDESPANKSLVCYVSSWTSSREWAKEGNQMSAPIRLKAGQRLYLEAIMREAGGGDNLAVRWQLPNDVIEEPIPDMSTNGTFMIPCWNSTNLVPGLYRQPAACTVMEQGTATFSVLVTNPGPVSYSWLMNGTNLPGSNALLSLLSLSNVTVAGYDGQSFSCVVSNPAGVVTSAVALLTVIPDTNPPTLLAAANVTGSNLLVTFSETVEQASATDPLNYSFDAGVTTLAAQMYDAQTVLLTVSPLTIGQTYTLTVNNIKDFATTPNIIASNSQLTFTALALAFTEVGNPPLPSSLTSLPDGIDIVASGGGIGGTSDQFRFDYQMMFGDFDVQVQVASLAFSDAWAKAGLMVRDTLKPNSRFAAVLASPGLAGAFFESRVLPRNGTTTMMGSFPVNYPNTWLRLQRTTNLFTGFASWDGQNWIKLGSATLDLTNCLLGFAVASHHPNQTTTVQFRNPGPGGGSILTTFSSPVEPPGPASRNTGLVISEIMYHPRHSNDLEFVEIFNAGLGPEEMGGYRLTGDLHFTFPAGTLLPAGGYLVVARCPELLQRAYGLSGVLGPWIGAETNALADDQGVIRLWNNSHGLALEVHYQGRPPWPLAADGAGHSLVLARASYGQDNVRAWAASDQIGGSPGRRDPVTFDVLRDVVINEFLANSDAPQQDYIELYNHSPRAVDLSGAFLSDDRDTNHFRIPDNTVLPERGFRVFYEDELGFALSSRGGRLFLVNSNQTRVLEALDYAGTAPGVSSGRFPDGGVGFQELREQTPGTTNSAALLREIVINEIMFHPISGDDDDQYIELYNRGSNAVNLGGWALQDAIGFTFPENTLLAAGGYLAVGKNAAHLSSNYPQLNAANTVGDFSGTLAHGGEHVALVRPEYLVTTNAHGVLNTNVNWIVVNEVTYLDAGRWFHWADGGGSSLELVDPRSDHRLAANWADSDETLKGQWTNVVVSGVLDNVFPVNTTGAALNEFQVLLLGEGEALMDDVAVQSGPAGTTNANLVTNPGFDRGLTNWLIQGNHVRSGLEPVGPSNASVCLRIRATGGGDNGANRIESDLSAALPADTTGTIAGRFRWLRGHPDVLMRLHGGGLDASFTLPVPPNLGTPGLPNSRLVANAGPALFDVTHWPVAPAAGQPVVVSARASDPDGVASVQLVYRLDPATNLITLEMRDDGTEGDAVAGDGLYSATLTGLASSNLVAFRVMATDGQAPAGRTVFPPNAPSQECLIRVGDPVATGTLAYYRLWVRDSNVKSWSSRERLSNEPVEGTLAISDYRVIYNATGRFRGSPFIRPGAGVAPTSGIMMYILGTPADEPFLGETEFNLDSLEHGGRDTTGLREPMAYWVVREMGQPFCHQRPIHMVVNGVMDTSRGTPGYIDVQQLNGSYVDMWFADENQGELFKIDDWFEFDHTVSMQGNKSASLQVYTTPSPEGVVKKKARYRWSWEKKANKGLDDDYSSLFAAVNALNAPDAIYPEQVQTVIEAEQWMTALALRHVFGDWDGYGYSRGKNQFTYRPPGKRFQMLLWDLDFSFGCTSGNGPTTDLFSISLGGAAGSDDMPEVNRMYNHPRFRRAYLHALQRIADGPLAETAFGARLSALWLAFQANNLTAVSPYVASGAQGLSIPEWVRQRRVYIYQQLAAFTNLQFALTSPGEVMLTSNLVTLTGVAPLELETLEVNGTACRVTWTSTTNWTVQVPLRTGGNTLVVQGYDRQGQALAQARATNVVQLITDAEAPQGRVVINEIMFHPTVPDAEYVELFNVSSNTTFDLSGWQFNGLDYTFPAGSILRPRSFLLLAKDVAVFLAAYDRNVPVFDQFAGNLQSDGETITLIKPGATPAQDVIVDQVRYEAAPPWPMGSNNVPTLAAIQLVDPLQDNSRPGNWTTRYAPGVYVPSEMIPASSNFGWRFMSVTGACPSAARILIYLSSPGICHIDDVSLVAGTVPEVGFNFVRGGDFETPTLDAAWLVGTNYTNSTISTSEAHSGNSSLRVVCTSFGNTYSPPVRNLVINQILSPAPTNTQPVAMGLWYYSTTSASNLIMQMVNSTPLRVTNSVAPLYTPERFIPGYYASQPVVGINPGQVNELASNRVVNPAPIVIGDGATPPLPAEPYPSTLTVSGYHSSEVIAHLSVQVSNLNHPIPAQLSLMLAGPDGRHVVLMGKCGWFYSLNQATFTFDDTATSGLASNVTASPGTYRPSDWNTFSPFVAPAPTSPAATNLAVFNGLNPNGAWSLYAVDDTTGAAGVISNGWSLTFLTQDRAGTPPVWLNEVQPVNLTGWRDQMGDPAPWLELYNPSSNALVLEECYLTDDYAQLDKWAFPSGATLLPGEFRLVVCDGLTNRSSPSEWHTSFRLDGASRGVALAQPLAGRLRVLDYLSFSNLTDGLSYGDWPDGQPFQRQVFAYPTPGSANRIAPPPPPIRVNEWMADNFRALPDQADGKFQDWFELYNPTTNTVDLSGWYLSRNPDNRRLFQVPPGYALGPLGYLLVWADEQTNQNVATSTDLHADFKLTKSGTQIVLSAPDGTVVDQVTFGPQLPDVSEGRYPDGAADIYVMTNFTPRAANVVPLMNTAPVLDPIGDQVVDEGRLLTVPVSVHDAEVPAQHLSFGLEPGAPAGASITAAGVFQWRPAEVFGPGTYPITVRVTDDGVPHLSASATFQVTVREVNRPPMFVDTRERYVAAGTLLSFLTAVDYDLPAQALGFEVVGGLPEGATLDPVSGVFAWRPAEAQAPAVYQVRVRATDAGTPRLSAEAIYVLNVLATGESRLVVDIGRTEGGVRLSWPTTPGRSYQVEAKEWFGAAWAAWGPMLPATGSRLSVTLPAASPGQRFLRVVESQP